MIDIQDRAKSIFLNALEIASQRDRMAYVQAQCGQDDQLRREVGALLDHAQRLGGFLESNVAGSQVNVDRPLTEQPGTQIGRYKLLEQVGEGGMGVVFVAEQTEPVRRRVALKIIKPGMDTRQVIARFEAERQALAMMDHPNIARILDAGTTGESQGARDSGLGTKGSDSEGHPRTPNPEPRTPSAATGRPYFVMELVRGMPITEYCDKARLSPRQRLELFADVCQAVQHAHQKGIIHRDLKPSNVMITLHDGTPVVKVIDFGVAKAVGQQLTERTIYTALTQLVGTPLYMSPEQAEMSGLDVDTRSDVYSLGVLLYELLTGQTPFDKETLAKAGLDEMRRIIREDEPLRPSRRFSTLGAQAISTISQHRSLDERRLSKILCGELDWIVMKALEKDRSRRYESASALSTDIQRYLSDEPVLACPPTTMYRFQKFARKHRPALATAVAVAASLILGTTVSAWQAARATQAEAQANVNEAQAKEAAIAEAKQRQRAEANEQKANTQRDETQKQRDEVKALNENLRATQVELRRTLYAAHMNLAGNAWDAGGPQRVMDLLEQHQPKAGEEDLRGFEWHYLNRLCHEEILTLTGHTGRVSDVAFSPDAKHIASASYDNTVKVWDAQTGKEQLTLQLGGFISSIAFSPDGKRLASTPWDNTRQESTVKVWDIQTRHEVLAIKAAAGDEFMAVRFSPDGKRLTVGSGTYDKNKKDYVAGKVQVWDAQTGVEIFPPKGHTNAVRSMAVSAKRLASGDYNGIVKVWNAETGQELHTFKGHAGGWVYDMDFSPDGSRLASAGYEVKVWNVETGEELLTIKDARRDVAFSPDGKRLATPSQDKTVKIWDAQTGAELISLRGHDAGIHGVAFSSDGSRLASSSDDQTIKLWDAQAVRKPITLNAGAVRTVAFSADGKRLASATGDWSNPEQAYLAGDVKVWDAATLRELLTFNKHAGAVSNVALSPDGKRVACALTDNVVRIWDAQTNQELVACKGHAERVQAVVFSPNGQRLAATARDRTLKVWHAQTGDEILTIKGARGAIAFSPDGKRLAGFSQGEMNIWDAEAGEALRSIKGASPPIAFSPDGKRLVTGSRLPNVTVPPGVEAAFKVWDAQTGQQLLTCKGHTDRVTSVAFSPDGRRLASASRDATIKLWDSQTGRELLNLEGYSAYISGNNTVTFSPDGHRLVSGGAGRTLKIWDATPLPEKP